MEVFAAAPQCGGIVTARPVLKKKTVQADFPGETSAARQSTCPDEDGVSPPDVECDFCTMKKLKVVKRCSVCLIYFVLDLSWLCQSLSVLELCVIPCHLKQFTVEPLLFYRLLGKKKQTYQNRIYEKEQLQQICQKLKIPLVNILFYLISLHSRFPMIFL